RDEGWARATVDQGLSVFERQHHLKRSEYSNFIANLRHGNFEATLLHFDQVRDLYNWKRDREAVGQVLDGLSASYTFDFSDARSLKVSVHGERDDYALYAHGGNLLTPARQAFESSGSGFAPVWNSTPGLANDRVEPGVAGGVREERQGIKLLGKIDDLFPGNRLALGGEYNRFEMGQADARGNNFILNEEIQRLGLAPDGAGGFTATGNVNATNTWVKPDTVQIGSLFVEDFYSVNDKLDLFGALRYDHHSNWGSQVSPRAGLLYSPSPQHTLRLSWQSGFRGAAGVQFAGGFVQDGFLAQQNFAVVNAINNGGPGDYIDTDFDGDPGNDSAVLNDVEPETMKSLELAWSWVSTDKRLHTNAVLFHNTIEHILIAQAQGYGAGHGFGEKIGSDDIGTWNGSWFYQNQPGELKHWGLEAELEWRTERFKVGASHALVRIDATNLGSLNVYALPGNRMVAYPEDITRFHIDAPLGRHLSAHYNHLWFWDFDLPNHTGNDGGHIGNLALNWNVPAVPELTLGVRVKNLWDERALYPTRQGSADAGLGAPALESRSGWLTLDYKF
ncbi:MAG: TonB-dependent receptor, partial [Moraxellaceae bacterium]|nr:TonB-dependent receptor [Moraxellaceae bacterium]